MTSDSEFCLNQAIDFKPLKVGVNESVAYVVKLLSQTKASCVLVIEKQKLVGIYTERDVVSMTAIRKKNAGLGIADVMSKNIISVTASQITDIFTVLNLMRKHRIRHLPILNELHQPIGIVTPKTIRK
ncbi:MAG: CBS domain-containing protein, partial [Cyanobacteria bacterium P01_C01_bin.38]